MPNRPCALLVASLLLPLALPAQQPGAAASPAPVDVGQLLQSERWAEAAAALEEIVRKDPQDAQSWFRLGLARHQLEQDDKAAAALDEAFARGHSSPRAHLIRAAVFAGAGDRDNAFRQLEKAVEGGVPKGLFHSEPALSRLRDDPRYPPLAQRIAAPCEHQPGFRRLDFWVGSWDVLVGDQKVGTNTIEKILKGCALVENWRDAYGGEGKSLFFYNAVTGQWKQVWVTDEGPLKEKVKVEEYPDGGVRFQGELPQPGGRSVLDRTTLTPLPGGRVRQVIEQSEDGGRTWRTGFDAVYVPHQQSP